MNITKLFSNINPREVIQNLPDAVFVTDSDGVIIWANERAGIIFDTERQVLKGINFDELVDNGIELAQKSHSRRTSIVTGAFAISGKEFFVEISARKYLEQFFITLRDVTELTNLLANAEKNGELNKEKNIMLMKLENEIKSPLQSIIGFSNALIDTEDEKQKKYAGIIYKSSTELLHFLDKLLEFSKAESSLIKYYQQPFDIINLIQTVIKSYREDLLSKGINVNFIYEEFNKKTVYSDENCLKIILQNLIETAIKLTDSGTITIKLEHPDMETIENYDVKISDDSDIFSFIKLSISDTGIGLTKSETERIFTPYAHLEKVNKKNITRSLILGTVYTITKKMGGAVKVQSEVMKGTTFTVILPVKKEYQ